MQDVDGFEAGADAYVYVIGLERRDDGTRWYYVGETTSGVDGLRSRFETHLDCGMSKPVQYNGIEVIDGALPEEPDHSYALIGVERAEPISVRQADLLAPRIAEVERRTAYEIAIEKETTNVIGGS
ncbi:hypothetical protein ACFQJ5_19235 [Halomicroarcula sp. GCM10025324]|uniref:hypothetical protein n=1 Tax=Halomicroarcula sp. GCM10025324 TaxID=3252667 RepID=UPI00361106D0